MLPALQLLPLCIGSYWKAKVSSIIYEEVPSSILHLILLWPEPCFTTPCLVRMPSERKTHEKTLARFRFMGNKNTARPACRFGGRLLFVVHGA